MKIENLQDFINDFVGIHIKNIACNIGFSYLDSDECFWKAADNKIYSMTDVSLRKLKDWKKQLIADREAFVVSHVDGIDVLALIKNVDTDKYGDLELSQEQKDEVGVSIMSGLNNLLTLKENELKLEIGNRP